MRLRDRIENLRARANSYNYCVCPREQIEEIINYLEAFELFAMDAENFEGEVFIKETKEELIERYCQKAREQE